MVQSIIAVETVWLTSLFTYLPVSECCAVVVWVNALPALRLWLGQ